MSQIELRSMEREDWAAVAELIYESTNTWYVGSGKQAIFQGPKESTLLFPLVYEQLDAGCCILAEDTSNGRIAGSCFYHPRSTHMSLGIMNVAPGYFGQGIAKRLLDYITDLADSGGKPVRLVSSAMNLDSFSLYSKAGFVPRIVFQDMILTVPESGLAVDPPKVDGKIREATIADVDSIAALEMELVHIERADDFRHFLENEDGWWHVSVLEDARGALQGFLASIAHPGSCMIGPGLARTEAQATALMHAELNARAGRTMVWLAPSECKDFVHAMYALGARNCEIHVAQCRGKWPGASGVMMPSFMPETA